MSRHTRREFLADVGKGMIVASVGAGAAADMGLAADVPGHDDPKRLEFGEIEPLVRLMQDTPIEHLMPTLVQKLKTGIELKRLLEAGALANARTFGGEDYIGFHTMMALAPAMHMAADMPANLAALPVLKVLYRNTSRIHDHGGSASEVLHQVHGSTVPADKPTGELLRDLVRKRDINAAEATFATVAGASPEQALNDAIMAMQDDTEVHRVVLPYRSWDMLGLIGKQHAHTLLRQSVRYCLHSPARPDGPKDILAAMLDQHHLLEKQPGDRVPDDAWVDAISIFKATPPQAAELAAAALADGIAPDSVGQAITLAANQLILRDRGRTPADEVAGKPVGSVHGDSIGVHACDSANAWRNLARVSNARNTYACLILGAYQVALDRVGRGGDFLNWSALPVQWQVDHTPETDAGALLKVAEEAVRGNLQAHACAAIHKYGQLGYDAKPVFDLMLKYACSEDGSLHAEKFYRTTSEEFATGRKAFRWRQVIALTRVTASEYGRPAAGYAEARNLLSA